MVKQSAAVGSLLPRLYSQRPCQAQAALLILVSALESRPHLPDLSRGVAHTMQHAATQATAQPSQPFGIGLTHRRTAPSRWKLSLSHEVEQVLEVFVMEPQQLAAELEAVGEPQEAANTLNQSEGQLGGTLACLSVASPSLAWSREPPGPLQLLLMHSAMQRLPLRGCLHCPSFSCVHAEGCTTVMRKKPCPDGTSLMGPICWCRREAACPCTGCHNCDITQPHPITSAVLLQFRSRGSAWRCSRRWSGCWR